jgi:prephenate dehydratase/chorismate mutase/prephenate dehydratase
MDLDEIRKRINTIDFEILKLLNSRMEYALRTKNLKKTITDTRREIQVIEYIQRHSQGLIEPDFCKKLFIEIIGESKRLQGSDLRLIGFQGEHGSFSEEAGRLYNPELMSISCLEYREVFHAVESGLLHFGIVPVENTLGGTVTDVNEFLLSTSLQIIGEVKIPIQYCLLALSETKRNEVRVVYSDRQALSHCQEFLARNNLEGRPYHDSSGAAKMLLRERPKASAAIASTFAAEFYNLAIIEEQIEDLNNNVTRYLILAREGLETEGDKCSIVFVAEHKAGALLGVLQEFADVGISLTRIESMPNRDDPGNYVFFLDFHGSYKNPQVAEVLSRVSEKTLMYKFLGCYPAANRSESQEV